MIIFFLFTVALYLTSIFGSVLLVGTMPLFYELACESAYPAAPGVTSGLLTLVMNLFGILSLLITFIPNIGTYKFSIYIIYLIIFFFCLQIPRLIWLTIVSQFFCFIKLDIIIDLRHEICLPKHNMCQLFPIPRRLGSFCL